MSAVLRLFVVSLDVFFREQLEILLSEYLSKHPVLYPYNMIHKL